MIAWQKYGNGRTPVSEGMKGDHFVGDYYVLFEKKLKEQAADLVTSGSTPEEARENAAPLTRKPAACFLNGEAGDPETVNLWQMMNSWVYEGFDVTYRALGVEFDKIYYESDTYKVGRDIVLRSLNGDT